MPASGMGSASTGASARHRALGLVVDRQEDHATSNDIRFDYQHRGDGGPLVIVPRIDGAPLTELIDGVEIAAGMQPAGDAYGGLIPEFFRFGPMQDHSSDDPPTRWGRRHPFSVVNAASGDAGPSWPASPRQPTS